jgi:DNA repair exonuclease SbcCD nuclease subunit
MNNEVLLFSDAHVHPHKRRNERLEDCLNTLKWVFQVAEEREIDNILFGGDLFHDRQKIEVYTYQRTFETLSEALNKRKIQLYLLLGNHDLWYNDNTNISSVIPFGSLPGVHVIANPTRLNIAGSNWDFIPFTHDPISTLEELKGMEGKPEYALGHIAIDGAILHGTQQADVAIEHDGDMVTVSASLFDHYKHTFLGHYHAEQRVNSKVEYIGSPLQLSFGEAFQEKHIIVFNGKTKKKEYIENTFSPKHLIISANERDKYDLKGNFVQIRVDDMATTDLISMKKEILEQTKLGSLEIKQQKKKIDDQTIQNARAILFKGDEMLTSWMKQVGAKFGDIDLNENELLQIGKIICQKGSHE